MLIDCNLKDVNIDALKNYPDCLVKYEIEASKCTLHALFEIRNLLRNGNFEAAEKIYFSNFWKKAK